MTAFASDMQRGACPALSAPMMTGDGLLARIALTDPISPAGLAEICRMALKHGNGMIDISARGNLQIRGLTAASAPRLDSDVRALNLPLRDGLAVEVPPLAGLDQSEIADPRPLADQIREAAKTIAGLAPKMSVVVDGHGQLRLSDLLADIRVVAIGKQEWKILLGGTEASGRLFNVLRETLVVDAVLGLLSKLAALGNKARGGDIIHDLSIDEDEPRKRPGEIPSAGTKPKAPSPFAVFPLSDNLYAVGLGPSFGQAMADDLIALHDEAAHRGILSVKPALDHSLLFFGTEPSCRSLQAFAADQGFITSQTDPRSNIAACSGSPACTSATIDTHAIAATAAAECADLLDGSFILHVTGCPKGCAHPQPSALALCGTATGVSFITQAKASGQPFASVAFADTNATLRQLADLVKSERQANENSATCLARLGSDRLAAAVTERP